MLFPQTTQHLNRLTEHEMFAGFTVTHSTSGF